MACFAPELIAAYPKAKIILTTRPAESWQKSMVNTIHAAHVSYLTCLASSILDGDVDSSFQLLTLIIKYYFGGDIPRHGIETFSKHNTMVRKLASENKRDFLEFQLGDDWEPLCEFLGKPVPDIDFPHVNDSQSFRKSFNLGWSFSVTMMASLGMVLLGLILGIFCNRNR